MSRHVAFLRGINLGKRRVKMAELRGHFRAMGLEAVETVGASGNVIFEHKGSGEDSALAVLERDIEEALNQRMDFSTAAFVRPLVVLREIAGWNQLIRGRESGFTPYVIFRRQEVEPETEERLRTLEGPDDRFLTRAREVVWLRRGGITESQITARELEWAMGSERTRRKITTVERVLEK